MLDQIAAFAICFSMTFTVGLGVTACARLSLERYRREREVAREALWLYRGARNSGQRGLPSAQRYIRARYSLRMKGNASRLLSFRGRARLRRVSREAPRSVRAIRETIGNL